MHNLLVHQGILFYNFALVAFYKTLLLYPGARGGPRYGTGSRAARPAIPFIECRGASILIGLKPPPQRFPPEIQQEKAGNILCQRGEFPCGTMQPPPFPMGAPWVAATQIGLETNADTLCQHGPGNSSRLIAIWCWALHE